MTLQELEIEVERLRKKNLNTYVYPGWNGKTWTEEREEENKDLINMKCPKCKGDMEFKVIHGTSNYTCKKDKYHTCTRWEPIDPNKQKDDRDLSEFGVID